MMVILFRGRKSDGLWPGTARSSWVCTAAWSAGVSAWLILNYLRCTLNKAFYASNKSLFNDPAIKQMQWSTRQHRRLNPTKINSLVPYQPGKTYYEKCRRQRRQCLKSTANPFSVNNEWTYRKALSINGEMHYRQTSSTRKPLSIVAKAWDATLPSSALQFSVPTSFLRFVTILNRYAESQ